MTFNYWLDPNGMLHNCGNGIARHNEWAQEYLLKNGYTLEEILDGPMPYEVMHRLGWIRIRINNDWEQRVCINGGCISLEKPMRNTMHPAMNERQMYIAKLVCEQEDFDFYKAINDKRFW